MKQNGDRPIEEYALIGDCETAALINGDGGVDWLCLPSFDGPSFFGALLDRDKGGEFHIRPRVPYRVQRGYLENSAIFETRFVTAEGVVKVTDFFVIARRRGVRGYDFTTLYPTRKLVRLVELESGSAVPMEMHVQARPNYGRDHAVWQRMSDTGFTCGHAAFFSNTELSLESADLAGKWNAEANRCVFAVLDYGDEQPVPDMASVRRWQRVTKTFWRHWNYFNRYRGKHEAAIRRSAVTLKLLTHAATGSFVAAPTTSLPEVAGGESNWDYRFGWVRDTSLFINTLYRIGYSGEATAFLNMVVGESMKRSGGDVIPVLYGASEHSRMEEQELDHLAGWRDSRPVRIGNRAATQFQIDNFAHVLEALYFYKHTGGTIDGDKMKLVQQVADILIRRWREPDSGLWEEVEPQQFTYGKVAAWAALMRAATLTDLADRPIKETCSEIRATVLARALHGTNGERHMVSCFDTEDVDAACLVTFLNGFSTPDLARATRQRIEALLADGPFLYRNPKQKEKGEGAFLICMFWRINHLVKEGEQTRAEELLAEVLAMQNPFGLLAEEIDPKSRSFLGNFPQAFSHLGLIGSVLNVEQARSAPEMAGLSDHEKFTHSVGATAGLWAIISGFFLAPKTLRLFFRSGGSKWKG